MEKTMVINGSAEESLNNHEDFEVGVSYENFVAGMESSPAENLETGVSRCSPEKQDESSKNTEADSSRQEAPAKNFEAGVLRCATFDGQNIFKGCKWSPDEIGNRILTCDGSNKLTIFHTFLNKFDYKSSQISDDRHELTNIGNVYDFNWYPLASASQYFAMVATSLGPIHIYDASTRQSIASYQMYNTNDEMVHAHSVACTPAGTRLIAGTSDYLFLFDVDKPGRTYTRILTRPNFKRGIISTIAVNPHRHSMFAVGTYNNRVGVYDDRDLCCVLFGHTKGISLVKFAPNGLLLYSGTRGSGDIVCWDLRNPGTALYKLERVVRTQQRIYFDITSNSRYILSGSTTGDVYVWDSLTPPSNNVLSPVHTFRAHEDCTNGLSIHHQLPFVVTVSGQYHHSDVTNGEEDDDFDHKENYEECPQENSLKLWHIDGLQG